MVKVEFLGPINKNSMEVEIANLSELSEILKSDSEVSTWLETCAVAINDMQVCFIPKEGILNTLNSKLKFWNCQGMNFLLKFLENSPNHFFLGKDLNVCLF